MSLSLKKHWIALRAEAEEIAGGLTDLIQRATVYRHIYRQSRGNHVFPLIAAHGALWAGGHFRFARRIASVLKWQSLRAGDRASKMRRLEQFMNVLRDINRRVCIDTYANFHFTARHGVGQNVQEFVPADLCLALGRVHDAIKGGRGLTDDERLDVFTTHFLNEQEHVVGPTVQKAFEDLDWPLVEWIARRPRIQFAYFRRNQQLTFRNFADREDRIRNGKLAFRIAAEAGWASVERALRKFEGVPAGLLRPSTVTT
jgi:hypothetical protein